MVYSLNAEYVQEIEVEEGRGEINIEYLSRAEDGKTFKNHTTGEWYKKSTAVTYVDDENNSLKFQVIATDITSSRYEQEIDFILICDGNFSDKYDIKNFFFTMKGQDGENVSKNHLDFNTASLKEENVEIWPTEERVDGSKGTVESYLGFDIEKNDFSVEVGVSWKIPRSNWNNSYTVRFQSVVEGLSKDVNTTVDVNLEKE